MKDKFFDLLRPYTDRLTFVTLRPNASLGLRDYRVPKKGLDVPVKTTDMAERIKNHQENEVINIPMIIIGIGYILGIDSVFPYKERYIDLIKASEIPVAQIWMAEAVKHQKEECYEESFIYARSLLLMEPQNDYALLMAGISAYQIASTMDFKAPVRKLLMTESLNNLETLYEEQVENPMINYYLGMIYRENKTYTKAMNIWEASKKLDMSEEEKAMLTKQMDVVRDLAAYENGYQLVLRDEGKEGLKALTPLLPRHPKWWNLNFFVGLAYEQVGDSVNALEHYKKVIEEKGFHEETYLQMAGIYMELNEAAKALSLMEELLSRDSQNVELKCQTALVAHSALQREKAKQLMAEVEKSDPEHKMLQMVKQQIQALSY